MRVVESSTVTVSVIVPCLDPTYLAPMLASLSAQVDAPPFEVLVVNAASFDLTDRLIPWRNRLDLRLIPGAAGGRAGGQRNRAASAARGSLLVFVDADDTVNPAYVREMSEALAVHPLVCSRVDLSELNPWNPDGTHPQETGLIVSEMRFLPFAGAGTLGIRRALFERIGGFHPTLPCYEEADLCWRIQLSGGEAPAFVSGAVLHVRQQPGAQRTWRKAVVFGQTQARLYRQYRSRGMPRERVAEALGAWGRLAAMSVRKARGRPAQGVGWQLGLRTGRLQGSIRFGVAYP